MKYDGRVWRREFARGTKGTDAEYRRVSLFARVSRDVTRITKKKKEEERKEEKRERSGRGTRAASCLLSAIAIDIFVLPRCYPVVNFTSAFPGASALKMNFT